VIGHKIGCTTAVMQEYLRIRQPAAGGVFASETQTGPGVVEPARYVRVGVECELAVRLGSCLPPEDAPYDPSDLPPRIDSVMAAIELVDDRYSDWSSLPAPVLIADDFFGAGCVLGPEVTDYDPARLGSVHARLLVDGNSVGEGSGAGILGEPLVALAWLANTMAGRGRSLREGEFVLLGSLARTYWVSPGDTVITVESTPLGSVEARLTT
jgi:2-oxo-3-hexenedioate decarboxylase/2-keto-4-pentenoate hydratase